jgi:hypothetical protein
MYSSNGNSLAVYHINQPGPALVADSMRAIHGGFMGGPEKASGGVDAESG